MAFGFSFGNFYIKVNSDSKWMTDKTDRTSASSSDGLVMEPEVSEFKYSVIACREPLEIFPKDCWVTFKIEIDWTTYTGEESTVDADNPGRLDVVLEYKKDNQTKSRHIVDNEVVNIGRNDKDGYYFKFGIYRTSGNVVPLHYNLAGYSQITNSL